MDFHNMKRKELQQLCKKHKLPANLSNFEMVDKLSSLFKVQEEEKEKPVRKTRSCLKNSDEMLSKNESDVSKKNVKKVRFNPESDVFQLGEKSERGFALENKGGAGRVTRGRASLLCKTVLISPVVMKKKGKRAVQEVEKEDLVVENKGGASQVTRARASLGKNVVVSSPVVMKKRAKRAVQEVEKKDLDVESKGGVSRVTRARTLVGEKVLIPSPVVMKKKGKKVVQEDEKGGSVVENQGGATRVTRARAGNQVLIPSPVVMKKRGKKAVQEDEKEDLVVENKGGASRVTRARAGKQVLISSPVVMKKRGKRAVQEEKKSGSAPLLVVDFTNPAAEEENEVIAVKFLRNRKVENVPSSKNIVRKRNSQKRSQSTNAEVLENKVAEADGGITQPKISVRRSTRNVNMSEESEGLMDESHETDQKASRKNLRQSTRQRASAKSSIEDADKNTVAVEISQPEVVTRQSKRNRQSTDESTRCQTRHGTKRMSVMPQMKKAKTEKPVAGNLGKKNIVVKDSPEESTKPIVVEEGSETGHIRSSKRNASGDGSLVIAEDENDCGTDIKTVTTKKPRRDAVLEEVPSQYTGRRVNRKVDNISDKPKEETPVASEPRTRSGNRQASLMHSAEKFNMSGNMGPCGTAGEKASPHYTREPSTVPKRSATGARQSKTVSVTPQTRSGSGQKSFIHTTKKLRMAGNSGLHKTLGDKESPHQSREISIVSSCSGTESKGRGLKSKQTPVIHEHSRRFTRSALKGKTDGPAYVRGKINQKKSQSVSKLTLSKVEVDRSTVNLVSNASDLPENKTACSTPQGDSAKTNSVDLYVQESEGPEMINIHEVSPSDPLNLQSNQVELEVDISTLQGGSPKTSTVDLNVQESEGPELMNVHEASPSDPLNLQSNNAGIEMDILTPQGGSPKTRSVDLNVQESERPELINICEALPSNPLILQSIHAELEMDISTPQGSSPKTSSVDLNVQESEGPDLINIREASPGDPLNVQSNHAEFEVDISTPQGGSPETSSVDLNVQESEGPELINILEASPSDTLNLLSNHAVHGDVNEDDTTGTQHENFCKTNVASPHSVHLKADAAAGDVFPADANALTDISLVDQSISTRTEERPELSNDIESISKVIDLNFVFQGPAIHEDEPVYRSPLPEVAEMDNSVTGKSDAACETQQEGPTEVDAKSPPLDHLMSADNIDITGDAGSIDTDYVDDYHLNVEHIISSAIKEKQQEVSENVNHVVAEGSTVNVVKSTVEVGDCGPTEQENDICKHPAQLPESGRLDKDSKSASKEVGEAVSSADIFFQKSSPEVDAKSPPLDHLMSADNIDITGDAGSIDTDYVDDYHLNVEHIISSAIKEKQQEVSKNVNDVVAEGSTVNEVKSTSEVGECGPTEQENDICKHPAELPESGRLDEDSKSASKEVGEAVSSADIFFQKSSPEVDAKSPPLDHLMPADNIDSTGDAGSIDTDYVDDYHLNVEHIISSAIKEKQQEVSENVNDVVAEGSTVNKVKSTAEVGECGPTEQENDICKHPDEFPESGRLDKDSKSASKEVGEAVSSADIFFQKSSPEVDAKSPPLDHLMSADNIDSTGDAGSIDTDYVDDYHLNVEHIISSAIKEKQQEVSENVNDVVAEGSTVNKVKSTAEVGECGPTEQENDICKHPDEFPESGRLDKDSKSASKEVGEAVSSADIFLQTVSMNFTVDKDDKMHPEISVQADEPHNTSSKSGMQEKEFPVPNSIANTEEVSILEYEFSKPEFSDTVTSTVMCSNKEFEEDNNQRLSTVESCLMREESGTKICIEFSTSNVVADSVAGENNKSQPRAPSSPLHATEFDNIVVEVKEELKPEDSPLSWRSDIFERIAVDGSSLQKERNLAKSTDVSEHNHWKNAEVKFENRKKVGAFDSTTREMSDMPEFTSSLPSHGTELGHLVAEVKEVKPKDSSSLWSTENVPKRTAEDGSSLHKQVGIEGREVEEMVFEDTVENASERTSSMFGDAHHILDGQQPTERECDLGEMTCSISGDVEERRMNENISRERTLFISKHDVDRGNISSPVIAHEFPSSVDDHCHTPSEDSCGKEQDMSMVKSSKNFGKEFSSQHDYFYGQLKDSCGKEEGTPMSIVKSSKYCGEEFSGQHDKIIDQVKVCSTAALPQTICEDFAGFDNQILPDLMGSTGRRMSRTGDLNIVKFEETEPSTVITDKIVDGIESLKENSSTLVRNLVEDSGGYCEKSDAEIATHDISEEDCYGKDAIDSYQIEDTVNYGEIDSNFKVIRQENDARPYLLHMDVDTINVEHFRDNLIASDTIHRFDQDTDASGMPTEEFPRYEEAMDADAPANLQDAGESVTLTGETNKAQGVPTEELTRTEDAMDADAPANVQYGNQEADTSGIPTEDFPRYEEAMDADAPANLQDAGESVTLTGETNKAQGVPTEELTITEDAMDADAPANLQYGNQEADASGMPTEEFPRYEEAMDADAPANLQDADAGESVTLTGETNKAQGNLCAIAWVPTEELTITEDAMDADAPANLQYGRESLTIPGETNQAQERGPEDISFCSDFFGPELKSRSDEVDGEESQSWFENSSFPGIELDSFMVSPTEEQLQNSGEKHAREKDPESIENQHAAFNNPSTGGDNVSVENSVGTLNESHIESEANKNAHQKVDCYNSNRSDEDFTKTES